MLTRLGLYRLLGENPERTWPVIRGFARQITKVLAQSWAYGDERLPANGPGVVAVNHFSALDPMLLGVHSRRTLYFMAKVELLSVPVAGELLRWTGAFAVRRGESDRDAIRMARWAIRQGHMLAMFAEGTRQQLGYPGPMHPGAAMLAIQEEVPVVPCGLDTFRWSLHNRRPCCVVWGEPVLLDLPRTGKGYKEGAALLGEEVTRLWRRAAEAVAAGFPEQLDDGSRRAGPLRPRETISHPELPTWPVDDWAVGPLGPVYRSSRRVRSPLR